MHEVPYYDSYEQPDELKNLEVPMSRPKSHVPVASRLFVAVHGSQRKRN
jgi:hypothetical protein